MANTPVTTRPREPNSVSEGADFLQDFITEADYAARRGVSLRTCQRDRQLRQAPPYVRFGRRIYYRIEAVREWLVRSERVVVRTQPVPRGRA